MILRLSEKLNTKVKAGPLEVQPLDPNPFADWSCHLFTVNRVQYILLSNTATMFSSVMLAKGVTSGGIFIRRTLDALREFLDAQSHLPSYCHFIEPTSSTVYFAKSFHRSITGSMNELVHQARYWLSDELSPFETSVRLNDGISRLLGINGSKGEYVKPAEAFEQLKEKLPTA